MSTATVVCSSCGQQTPAGFPRCANCGAPLSTEAEPRREERKVVTVLFCDLVGSTARAEGADPEDVRALLSAYHERVRSELERFGGTVEKFIGDAVMALFGAPTAHEDDPERAVRAALVIREWAQEDGDLQVRIGITTGEALVALGARPAAGEGMASGDVVNTAARLQAGAPANGVLVDQPTCRATERVIEYEEHKPIDAKGKAAPIAVWQALEARARFGVDVRPAARGPLVGRTHELDVLVGALARVRREREPQLVTLIGVPGIGKSRLVWELFQAVGRDPDLIYWRQGRSLPYGDGVTYWALGEMVKAQAGILETDTPELTASKLERAVSELFPEPADARWIEAALRPLVGIAVPGESSGDRDDEAFAAWRRFFEALAEMRPLVLVFEDLHFADEGLLAFLDHLVDWASGVPILVVCSARPELLARRPDWGGGKPNATTLSLSPLSDEETARLVHALLERAVLPAETQASLLERAGGNPLYAEEFASMVSERAAEGADGELPLPESVQGIIAARLDALPADEKALLQDAAVVGKVFWLGSAAAIAGLELRAVEERLHALGRKEFVRRDRRSSVAEETEYAFRHLLVRDVAYAQIPRAARAAKHRLAAEWITSLGRPEDQAEMIAHHYLAALEFARAAGQDVHELAERARLVLRDAGDRAVSLGAQAAAARFYGAALGLWPDDDERPYLLLRAGTARFSSAEEGFEELEAAVVGLLAAGDRAAAADAESVLGSLYWRKGRNDVTAEHDARAEALLADAPPSASKASVLTRLSGRHMVADRADEAIEIGREAIRMAEQFGLDDVLVEALNNVGTARANTGDWDGFADLERAIALARKTNRNPSRAQGNYGECLREYGDLRKSRELFEEGRREAERRGHAGALRWLEGEQAVDLYWGGAWDESLRIADERIAESEGGAPHWMDPVHRGVRGLIRLARGDLAGAWDDAAKALDFCRVANDPQMLFPALAFNARVLLATGRAAEARERVDELLALWSARRAMMMRSSWGPELAFASAGVGRERAFLESVSRRDVSTLWIEAAKAFASRRAADAADTFADIGARPEEAYSRLRAADVLISSGRGGEGQEQLQRALAFYRSVGAAHYIREGEALVAQTA
jgi:class 3 adenylate cyclase